VKGGFLALHHHLIPHKTQQVSISSLSLQYAKSRSSRDNRNYSIYTDTVAESLDQKYNFEPAIGHTFFCLSVILLYLKRNQPLNPQYRLNNVSYWKNFTTLRVRHWWRSYSLLKIWFWQDSCTYRYTVSGIHCRRGVNVSS
jgi:hypothetical protein